MRWPSPYPPSSSRAARDAQVTQVEIRLVHAVRSLQGDTPEHWCRTAQALRRKEKAAAGTRGSPRRSAMGRRLYRPAPAQCETSLLSSFQ
ncbi:hypothetical protein CBM2623_B170062 [Cupriavidus taiwanensis]|nr:hypothetical protein CBM2608_B140134 [Cupriavidus taiwanensis]SPA32865.1 hypothetical protein CBM2623_B170062 [Cupriavidus taiwanensis]SPA48342.1 hypothetical protein CBM2629_B10015 [Cupriavidus taiwanensis]